MQGILSVTLSVCNSSALACRRDIKSLRDLRGHHLPLLDNIVKKGTQVYIAVPSHTCAVKTVGGSMLLKSQPAASEQDTLLYGRKLLCNAILLFMTGAMALMSLRE